MVRRSRRRGLFERLRSQVFNTYPHRCMLCYTRYWDKLDETIEPQEAATRETLTPPPHSSTGRSTGNPDPFTIPRGR